MSDLLADSVVFFSLLDHIEKRGPMTIMVDKADDEYIVHTEWSPLTGDITTGNATGYGVDVVAAVEKMLINIDEQTYTLLNVPTLTKNNGSPKRAILIDSNAITDTVDGWQVDTYTDVDGNVIVDGEAKTGGAFGIWGKSEVKESDEDY